MSIDGVDLPVVSGVPHGSGSRVVQQSHLSLNATSSTFGAASFSVRRDCPETQSPPEIRFKIVHEIMGLCTFTGENYNYIVSHLTDFSRCSCAA